MGEDLLISQGFNEYSHYEVILLRRLTTPALRHVADTLFILALVIGLALAARPLYASSALPIPSALPASEPGGQVPGYTIVVDPGHGGKDGGAIGARTGIPEAGLNLTVSQLVQAGLEAAGYQVILTRGDADALGPDKQADMAARKAIMNQPGVDLVVSIHMNKFSDPSVSGPMAFYMQGSQPGEALATQVIQALCTALDRPLRKANPGDYFVIRESTPPSVLVECGFLSNAQDESLLQDPAHQQKLADGIVAGVRAYLESAPDPTAAPCPPPPHAPGKPPPQKKTGAATAIACPRRLPFPGAGSPIPLAPKHQGGNQPAQYHRPAYPDGKVCNQERRLAKGDPIGKNFHRRQHGPEGSPSYKPDAHYRGPISRQNEPADPAPPPEQPTDPCPGPLAPGRGRRLLGLWFSPGQQLIRGNGKYLRQQGDLVRHRQGFIPLPLGYRLAGYP